MTEHLFEKSLVKIEFPNPLEILVTTELPAPVELVFDVMTRPEHLRHTLAPFEEQVTVCDFDVRTGGSYHYIFVTPDGRECSFRGKYLEVSAPYKTVETWIFDGWKGVEALETVELTAKGTTTFFRLSLKFKTAADRAHMSKTDGVEAGYQKVAEYLESLQNG